jgi:glyoxylase-like metal-dependent hydrolase (beta-lactamase superfamily II)
MIEEITTNIYKIEIPLPDSPLEALNSYLIKDSEKNLIIDTGLNQEECMKAMQTGLVKLGVDIEKTDFFITHFHPDHLGLVSKLAKTTSSIYFNRPEADMIKSGFHRDRLFEFARRNGFPNDELQSAIRNHPAVNAPPKWHPSFRILKEGDTISIGDNLLKCVETPGHSRGHMCLYESDKEIFFAGDLILSGVTPGIQLWSDDWDPLREYLDSLDKVQRFNIELILPGHGDPFGRYRERIQQLKRHHQKRLDEIISILERGKKNAFQIGSQMSWDLSYDSWDFFPVLQKMFAMGEAMAHLKYLEGTGTIRKEMLKQKIVYSLD